MLTIGRVGSGIGKGRRSSIDDGCPGRIRFSPYAGSGFLDL